MASIIFGLSTVARAGGSGYLPDPIGNHLGISKTSQLECSEEQKEWLKTFEINSGTLEVVNDLLKSNDGCLVYYESIEESLERTRLFRQPQFIQVLCYHSTIYSPLKIASTLRLAYAIFPPPTSAFRAEPEVHYGGNFFESRVPQSYFAQRARKDSDLAQCMLKAVVREHMNKITSIGWIEEFLQVPMRHKSNRGLFIKNLVTSGEMIPDILAVVMKYDGVYRDIGKAIFDQSGTSRDELFVRCMAAHCDDLKIPAKCLATFGAFEEMHAEDRLSRLDMIARDQPNRANTITNLQCRLQATWIHTKDKILAIEKAFLDAPSNFFSPYTINKLNEEKRRLEMAMELNEYLDSSATWLFSTEKEHSVDLDEIKEAASGELYATNTKGVEEAIEVAEPVLELTELMNSVTITSNAPTNEPASASMELTDGALVDPLDDRIAALRDRARAWSESGGLKCQEYAIAEQLTRFYMQGGKDENEQSIHRYIIGRADSYLRSDGEEVGDVCFVLIAMGYLLFYGEKLDFSRFFKKGERDLSWEEFCSRVHGYDAFRSSILFHSKLASHFSLDELRLLIDSSAS